MTLVRTSTAAAALLFALTGIASAATKGPPQAISQTASQPKSMAASHSLMSKKHNFLAAAKAGSKKDKAHGWMAPAKAMKSMNAKKS